jgi:hypothetical protein
LSTLFPANPIASNPIQLSRNLDRWDPRFPPLAAAGTVHPSTLSIQQRTLGHPFPPARPSHNNQPSAWIPKRAGGADRVRTDDIRLAKAALSHLSYSPLCRMTRTRWPEHPAMVGLGRFELPTSRLSGVRSNQLSYRPRTGTTPIPWKLDRGFRSTADRPGRGHPFTRKGFRTCRSSERR